MTVHDVGIIKGLDIAFYEQLYAILRYEEWKGPRGRIAQAMAQHIREALKEDHVIVILQRPDDEFVRSISDRGAEMNTTRFELNSSC